MNTLRLWPCMHPQLQSTTQTSELTTSCTALYFRCLVETSDMAMPWVYLGWLLLWWSVLCKPSGLHPSSLVRPIFPRLKGNPTDWCISVNSALSYVKTSSEFALGRQIDALWGFWKCNHSFPEATNSSLLLMASSCGAGPLSRAFLLYQTLRCRRSQPVRFHPLPSLRSLYRDDCCLTRMEAMRRHTMWSLKHKGEV